MAPKDELQRTRPSRAGRSPEPLGAGLDDLERLRGLVTALTRDPATTDDVLQETWLASRRMPATVNSPGQVAVWLRTTARRLASRRLRDDQSRAMRERVAARRERVEDISAERIESFADLLEALGELSEPYRSTIRLRYLDGLAPREIARRLDRSPELVRQHLHRGLERLRTSMDRRHGGGEAGRQSWMAALIPVRSGTAAAPSVATLILTTILMKVWILPIAAVVVGAFLWLPSRDGSEASGAGPVAPGEAAALVRPDLQDGPAAEPIRTVVGIGEEPALASVDGPGASVAKPEIRLRFVDFETRVPVPTAELRVLDRSAEFGEEARVLRPEPDGILTLDESICREEPTLLADAPGYGRTILQDPTMWLEIGGVFEVELFFMTRVSGRVLGPDGGPIAGARVFGAGDDALRSTQLTTSVRLADGEDLSVSLDMESRAWRRQPRTAKDATGAATRIGPDGFFSLEIPLAPPPIGPDFPISSDPFLVVQHPEFERLELHPGSEQELYNLGDGRAELILTPHAATTGITVDESEMGIAEVRLIPAKERQGLEDLTWLHLARSVTSAEGGRFAGDLDLESTEALWCFAPGYADRRLLRKEFELQNGELRVRMERGHDLVVQVFDDSGAPVPGVLVEIEPFRELAKTEFEARTDAAGLATFERLARGTVEVGVKTGARYLSEPGRDVEVPCPAVVFQLARPVRFTGDLIGVAAETEGLRFEQENENSDKRLASYPVEHVVLTEGRYHAPLKGDRGDRVRLVVWGEGGLSFVGPWFDVDAGIVELDVEFEATALERAEGAAGPPE